MLDIYPAIFHAEEPGYWVEFPDLKGCVTQGDSLAEAMSMAQEALGLYLVSLMERNISIPEPSSLSTFTVDDGIVTYVSTDTEIYRRDTRAVKKTLSIPAWLAKEAESNNLSLSRVLQDAIKERLNLA